MNILMLEQEDMESIENLSSAAARNRYLVKHQSY